MALFHWTLRAQSRTTNANACAISAYARRATVVDHSDPAHPRTHSYARKAKTDPALAVGLVGAGNLSPSDLWSAAERAETRRNSTVCRTVELSLPRELGAEDRATLARQYAEYLHTRFRVPVDYGIHGGKDGQNPHVHYIIPTRALEWTPDGPRFGKKLREWDDRKTGSALVNEARQSWADIGNRMLRERGFTPDLDPRSYEARGIARVAGKHLSKEEVALERAGIETERAAWNRLAKQTNTTRHKVRREQQHHQALDRAAGARPMRHASGRHASRMRDALPTVSPRQTPAQTERIKSWVLGLAYGRHDFSADFRRSLDKVWTLGEPAGAVKLRLTEGRGRVTDDGRHVRFQKYKAGRHDDPDAVRVVLDLAARHGWQEIEATGTRTFREALTRAAVRQGLTVTNPDLQHIVQQERQALAQRQASQAQTRRTVAGINAAAARSTPAALRDSLTAPALRATNQQVQALGAEIQASGAPEVHSAWLDVLRRRAVAFAYAALHRAPPLPECNRIRKEIGQHAGQMEEPERRRVGEILDEHAATVGEGAADLWHDTCRVIPVPSERERYRRLAAETAPPPEETGPTTPDARAPAAAQEPEAAPEPVPGDGNTVPVPW